MPISLRLPSEVDSQIASYSVRLGVSKSAIIVRSIEEFLARNAQPSAYQLYVDAMKSVPPSVALAAKTKSLSKPGAGHKPAVQKAMQLKHKERSARAVRALQRPDHKAA